MAEKIEFDLSVKGGATNNELNKALSTAENSAISLEGAIQTAVGVFAGNTLTKGLDLLKTQLGKAVDESISFRRAQLEIETILPKNTKLTADLVGELEALSSQYGTTATAQAKAYYEIISAGVSDATDGTKLLARANELATGGVTDTANTIDLLTTIYNVYGKELATTTEASDSLFKTVQIGKTTIRELSQDLGQALPIAKSFGIGLDEVGSVLAQLTNSGISTAESVTLLNSVLTAIARNGKVLGAGFDSTAVQTEGLGVVLNRLKERTNGSSDALLELLGRQEAVRAVQSLTSKGLENYNAVLAEYANKTGVAAEASKKIVENDIGKQFDILSSKILNASKDIAGPFVSFLGTATKAINDFFTDPERDAILLRELIASVNKRFEEGSISLENYNLSMEDFTNRLATATRQLQGAESPLISLSVRLQQDAKTIQQSILDVENGISGLTLAPIEKSIKLESLNAELDQVNKKIKDLTKVDPGVSSEATPAPIKRDQNLIDDEFKLQQDLLAIKQQFALEDQNLAAQRDIFNQENALTKKQLEIDALYEKQATELAILTETEFAKTKLIQDEGVRRLAQEKIIQENGLKQVQLLNKKEQEFDNAKKEFKKKTNEEIERDQADTLTTIATLASSNNKALATIGKAAALTQIAIDGPVAVTKAFSAFPPPFNFAAAAAVGAAVSAQAAKVAGVQFENGGPVGGTNGASVGGDNRVATIRDGEFVLNGQDQKVLFDALKSGNLGGGDIIIKIDEREIARAVRNQKQQGFAI
jgi:TP901 family phage tail tape measure protein